MTTFSTRLPLDLRPNSLATAIAQARDAGRVLLDLTQSNPTQAGFPYPSNLLTSLADAGGLSYEPAALGLPEARNAVASDYARRGFSVAPNRIALTASTSEAYSLLFKILCEPGDEVLVPRPSYPLFDHLTRLEGVSVRSYDLDYHGTWRIDSPSLKSALSEHARAVLLVSPNNPTGSFVTRGELDLIVSLCEPRGVAVVADEVFADYELDSGAGREAARFMERQEVLLFSLGGLSKTAGLPQLKLSWIGVTGPDPLVDAALSRLELACDTYLSVSTPMQLALPSLLEHGGAIRSAIQARVRRNLLHLSKCVAEVPACELLKAEGGWSAILRIPSLMSEEDLVLRLLREDGVLVHPGYFFDFRTESYLVVSLLTPEGDFDEGIHRVLRRATRG